MQSRTSNVIAGCLAMAAFSVAIVAGIAGGNAAASILARALVAMVLCYPVGLVIGLICERVADDEVLAHRSRHPLPEAASTVSPDGSSPVAVDVGPKEDVVVT